ncbi:hypothetical protein CRP01_30005 [Flavilitoribacter nigricans DSM 23189 = NBRC 102662]|uniref:Uncharacterized protein n=1 Tax=Flavilitoribacter nigricans (strain ATCC 23147 / DSM 23189 / NBRC 102662 / NCIMB 1420 / SS-2) TaxID=1122177 RepID=A0A2D0N2Y5_FLAN2|nr:hypothetical protein CRP01_30005 [Flavilitoribacter nigricans DSM 23189 = NBRC 102662]
MRRESFTADWQAANRTTEKERKISVRIIQGLSGKMQPAKILVAGRPQFNRPSGHRSPERTPPVKDRDKYRAKQYNGVSKR